MPQPYAQLVAHRAVSATGNSGELPVRSLLNGDGQAASALLCQSQVTAISGTGTPTITVVVEDSVDGVTWRSVGTFAAQTTTNTLTISIAPSGVAQAAGFAWPINLDRMRVRWTVSGTNPSITFTVRAVGMRV